MREQAGRVRGVDVPRPRVARLERAHELVEAVELLVGVRVVGLVGDGEVRAEPTELELGRRGHRVDQLGGVVDGAADAVHAGVDLEVDRERRRRIRARRRPWRDLRCRSPCTPWASGRARRRRPPLPAAAPTAPGSVRRCPRCAARCPPRRARHRATTRPRRGWLERPGRRRARTRRPSRPRAAPRGTPARRALRCSRTVEVDFGPRGAQAGQLAHLFRSSPPSASRPPSPFGSPSQATAPCPLAARRGTRLACRSLTSPRPPFARGRRGRRSRRACRRRRRRACA